MIKGLKRGQIVWCDLNGEHSEQSGKRPSIIVQNDVGNKFSTTTIIVPLTAQVNKANLPTHVYIGAENFKNTNLKNSTALCEQIRVVDKNRIATVEDCILSDSIMEQINNALKVSFGIGSILRQNYKILWIRLESGMGSEHKSKNPVPSIVLQNDTGNKFSPTMIVAPLAERRNKKLPTQVCIPGEQIGEKFNDCVALLEQVRVIDKRRITHHNETTLSENISKSLEKAILLSLGIK